MPKMEAKVIAVGDGLQAVEALNCSLRGNVCREGNPLEMMEIQVYKLIFRNPNHMMILMDCVRLECYQKVIMSSV